MFGFKIYHTTPNGKAYESAIIIKNNVKHFAQEEIKKKFLQATIITYNSTDFNIVAAYCPSRHNIKEIQFEEILRKLGSRFIIEGDFNTKHIA